MELSEKFNIEPTKVEELQSGLAIVKSEREVLIDAYNDVIDLEITPENVAIFKELRLKIVKNRTQGIEKWHKNTKEIFLRSGQLVDAIKNAEVAINKDMEDKLESAEKYFENLEKQRIATLHAERIEMLRPFVDELTSVNFGEMDAQIFEDYLAGAKLRFEAKKEAEAKAEAERLAEIERQRKISENRNALLPFSNWIKDFHAIDFESVNVAEVLESAKQSKATQEAEAEAQRIENERLRKEAQEKEEKLEKRNESLRPYIRYIRDYKKVLALSDADFEKELSILNKEAVATMKFEADRESELKAEREKQAKLEAELEAKKLAELKAETARIEAERLAKLEAEKLAKAPIKKQLSVWVDGFEIANAPIENATGKEIEQKFNAFKKWAQSQINNL